MIYDNYYKYDIPRAYVYRSKQLAQLKLVNSMNICTSILNNTSNQENIPRPLWYIHDSKLHANLLTDVMERDEKIFCLKLIAFYFLEIKAAIGQNLTTFLIDFGYISIIVETSNHKYVISIKDIQNGLIKKN